MASKIVLISNSDHFSPRGQDCLVSAGSGVFYLITAVFKSLAITDPQLEVWKTVDDGDTWSLLLTGPELKFVNPGGTNWTGFDGYACVYYGSFINIFYIDRSTLSSRGITGVLSYIQLNIGTDSFGPVSTSDINAGGYIFNGVATYTDTSTVITQPFAFRTSSSTFKIVHRGERNTSTNEGRWYLTTFDGLNFGSSVRLTESGSDPSICYGGLMNPESNILYMVFEDEVSFVPYLCRVNDDGTLDRIQDFSVNDVGLLKYSQIIGNDLNFNYSYRPVSSDFATLLYGDSMNYPTSVTQENVSSALPLGTTYLQPPQVSTFRSGSCMCSFAAAKKVGAAQLDLLRTFRTSGGFWSANYTVEASYTGAEATSYGDNIDDSLHLYSGIFHDSNKFSGVIGGALLLNVAGATISRPLFFVRGDIAFHSSCTSIVPLSVQVSDTLVFADQLTLPSLSTPTTSTPVHNCPEIIVSSAFCATIKTSSDGETSPHDCEETVYSETTQPCEETGV